MKMTLWRSIQVLPLGAAMTFAVLTGSSRAATITQWNFQTIGTQAAPYNSPAPTTGAGTALTVGMNNSYNGGNTASADVLSTLGGAGYTEFAWRIRGTTHNGWATHAAGAPQYSQGAEFDVSTVGYSGINVAFDWFSTNQGIRDLQFQYNLDVTNPAGWTNFGDTSPTGTYIAVPNDWYNAPNSVGTPSPTITIDLSSIVGASNDPNFGIRMVAAFDSTGNLGSEFASATLASGLTQTYNNTSGNWRFGTTTVSGNPVPEPSSLVLVALGGMICGVSLWRRRSNNKS